MMLLDLILPKYLTIGTLCIEISDEIYNEIYLCFYDRKASFAIKHNSIF